MITFEEYKLKAAELYNTLDVTSAALRAVTEGHTGAMGLVSREVRNSAAFKDTKEAHCKAYNAVRLLNGSIPKEYMRRNRKYNYFAIKVAS